MMHPGLVSCWFSFFFSGEPFINQIYKKSSKPDKKLGNLSHQKGIPDVWVLIWWRNARWKVLVTTYQTKHGGLVGNSSRSRARESQDQEARQKWKKQRSCGRLLCDREVRTRSKGNGTAPIVPRAHVHPHGPELCYCTWVWRRLDLILLVQVYVISHTPPSLCSMLYDDHHANSKLHTAVAVSLGTMKPLKRPASTSFSFSFLLRSAMLPIGVWANYYLLSQSSTVYRGEVKQHL